jgi:hypothetical protein
LQSRGAVHDVLDGVAAPLEELGDVRRDIGVIFDQQQIHDRGRARNGSVKLSTECVTGLANSAPSR